MFVAGFPSAAFGTNCYLLAPAVGEQCVIVDPGVGVAAELAELVREYHLRPVAVLLTHGHVDHTFSVVPVCGAHGVPAYLHPADRHQLKDPASGLSPQLAAMLHQLPGGTVDTEPDDVLDLADGARLELAGLTLTVDHAPGHTEGSVMFRLPGPVARVGAQLPAGRPELVEASEVCLAGDVLFAGSVGRVDMPGGSAAAMADSLRRRVLPLADTVAVLPGHGPHTTIGAERRTNPYLQDPGVLAGT
jgi:glyoxylase-like metal-dependent hydrolase (beta-lactamase superfamily II)